MPRIMIHVPAGPIRTPTELLNAWMTMETAKQQITEVIADVLPLPCFSWKREQLHPVGILVDSDEILVELHYILKFYDGPMAAENGRNETLQDAADRIVQAIHKLYPEKTVNVNLVPIGTRFFPIISAIAKPVVEADG